ncbi:MAG: DUF192 domain-containing protein [Sphingomonadales bacterium]|nr:DUF192 domain-containing protein [Sphingomonadales bacterium]
MRWIAPSVLALLLGACSPGSGDAAPQSTQPAPAVHPVSGLPVVPLTISHASKVHTFRVEVASTGQQQMMGLMFRTQMGADEGMIFPTDPPRTASFWMRNTVIPLDIIFVGVDGKILNIAANAVPYDETPLPSAGVVKGVLELNGGRAKELGIGPGDVVGW